MEIAPNDQSIRTMAPLTVYWLRDSLIIAGVLIYGFGPIVSRNAAGSGAMTFLVCGIGLIVSMLISWFLCNINNRSKVTRHLAAPDNSHSRVIVLGWKGQFELPAVSIHSDRTRTTVFRTGIGDIDRYCLLFVVLALIPALRVCFGFEIWVLSAIMWSCLLIFVFRSYLDQWRFVFDDETLEAQHYCFGTLLTKRQFKLRLTQIRINLAQGKADFSDQDGVFSFSILDLWRPVAFKDCVLQRAGGLGK